MKKEYYIAVGQSKKGPFDLNELKKLSITETTLVWKKGMDNWKKAMDIEDLKSLFIDSPPVIPKENANTSFVKNIDISKNIAKIKATNFISDRKLNFVKSLKISSITTLMIYLLLTIGWGGWKSLSISSDLEQTSNSYQSINQSINYSYETDSTWVDSSMLIKREELWNKLENLWQEVEDLGRIQNTYYQRNIGSKYVPIITADTKEILISTKRKAFLTSLIYVIPFFFVLFIFLNLIMNKKNDTSKN